MDPAAAMEEHFMTLNKELASLPFDAAFALCGALNWDLLVSLFPFLCAAMPAV